MAFSEASMSLGSQQDPLGLFSEEDQMLPEPNQELLSIEDVPLGQAVAEPAQNSAPNPQDTPVAASRTKGRRASAVSSPLHILIPEDAIGGMETLFADPSLGDAICYSISAPGFRNQHVLFTYVRCACPLSSALDQLQSHGAVTGCRGVVESHKDGTPHLHIYVQKSKTMLSWNQVTVRYSGMSWRPHARVLSTQWHRYNTYLYLEKEGVPQQSGRFCPPLKPSKAKGIPSGQELLTIATGTSVDLAIQEYVAQGGSMSSVVSVRRGLESMLEPPAPVSRFRPRAPDIVLQRWQVELLEALNKEPSTRTVHWCYGPPACGKTTFTTWLGYPSNYEGGILVFQSCDNLRNALHRYTNQACVVFDYPFAFDWVHKADSVGTVLECFSEYGARRESEKYVGRSVLISCHCVVFANIPPIEQVTHRNVNVVEIPPLLAESQASTMAMGPRFLPGVGVDDSSQLPNAGRDRSRSRSPR